MKTVTVEVLWQWNLNGHETHTYKWAGVYALSFQKFSLPYFMDCSQRDLYRHLTTCGVLPEEVILRFTKAGYFENGDYHPILRYSNNI